MPYLNVDEVESALDVATTAPFDDIAKKFDLPNLSVEQYQTHLIKLGNGDAPGRPGIYFLGGVHAREWGSADILVNFIELVENAYKNGTGITIGGASYTATEIKSIVDDLDIFIFPQCNPDGRAFSMKAPAQGGDGDWRKNRRTKAPNSNSGSCIGVDINRNFDFLWNIDTQWAASSTVNTTTDPCNKYTYNGEGPMSEPETQNAAWVHDHFPNIRFFVDLHSFSQDILYSWGDDDNQSSDPSMNFMNPAYDSVRGILGDNAYNEYIPSNEEAAAEDLANAFAAGIKAVKGVDYLVEQSVGLYPTSGASDDYSYSRHYVDPAKSNVTAFTLEWGPPPEYHPDYDTAMTGIIDDITSGLIAYCLWVRKSIEGCSITLDRSTFGKDEVDAMLHIGSPAYAEDAFYVVFDGFRAEELGVTAATLVDPPNIAPAIAFGPLLGDIHAEATRCSAEGNSIVAGPQRFTWTYRMRFDSSNDFTMESQPVTITASLPTTLGPTITAQAIITLTTQPNPYEIDGKTSWLAVDLQVFNLPENGSLTHTSMVKLDSGPLKFVQDLLAAYNDPMLPRAPGHPFDLDLVANEDSSAVEIAGTVGPSPGTPVYNFAIARVRYRALSTAASNVRVFFRVFQASTTSTAYESATYPIGGDAGVKIPLLGVVNGEVVTIPFFAESRVNPNNPKGLNAQKDSHNIGPLGGTIPPDASGKEVQVYFGCWLDINQDVPTMPGGMATAAGPYAPAKSIQQLISGKHQCLVAEINLDPPEPQIANGVTPSTSDKLAQRNLNVVGVASPHLVPVAFDIKPTATWQSRPDELMIDWSGLPAGTTATIFLPRLDAPRILTTANRLYANHGLSAVDQNTLACKAEGVTYVPIPSGIGSNYAGLLTLDIPETVKRGEKFKAVARQITSAVGRSEKMISWRRIIGSFQVNVPVSTKQALLAPEQRLLSVLRWIAKSMSPASRWFPVMQRYLDQTATRVDALGGDSTQIKPTSSGDWQEPARCGMWLRGVALTLSALLLSLGTLAGPPLKVVAIALLLLLVITAVLWSAKCHPGFRDWMRALALGAGLGATLLVLALLFGLAAPTLLIVLCASVLLMAIGFVVESSVAT